MSHRTPRSPSHDTRPRAGPKWESARGILAVTYLLGGAIHLVLGALSPELYFEFADRALLDSYTTLWRALVVPNLAVLQPLVTLFEVGVGAVLLWRGAFVRVGHTAGAVFQLALVLSGPWGPINALIAAVHLTALGVSYPTSAIAHVRGRTLRNEQR